jgi:glycosyltransferase involved in cell wall biosynthesis
MITGDKKMLHPGTEAHARFLLQAAQVEKLVPLYWGKKSLWPRVPSEHFDVVTVQDPFWRGLFGMVTARRLHAKLNVQIHTDKFYFGTFILRRADSIRVVSEKIKQSLVPLHLPAPVSVLPIFLDIEQFKKIERKPHDKKTILWVGRFENEKNPMQAIEILKQVHAADIDAKLILLGAGSLEKKLKQSAERLPVEFPGWQDPKPFLAGADVVLCTSLHESWGASIIEALAAGVPVVAPDVGIAKEAGAIIADHDDFAASVIDVLQYNRCGELKLKLLSRDEWAVAWKHSL